MPKRRLSKKNSAKVNLKLWFDVYSYCSEQMEAMKAQEQAYHQQMEQQRQQPFHQATRASPALSAKSSNSRGSPARLLKGQPNRPTQGQGHLEQNFRPRNFGHQEMAHESNMMPGQNASQNYGYNPWSQSNQQMSGRPQPGQRALPYQNQFQQGGPQQQLSWQQGNYPPQNGGQMNRLPYLNHVRRFNLISF